MNTFLRTNRLSAKKNLGQNFLCSQSTLNKIIEAAEINSNDVVVEIGPGLGTLTRELVQRAAKIHAVELDENLIPFAKFHTNNSDKIKFYHQNALQFIPPEVPYKLVANIPYYITSPLLTHFLFEVKTPALIVLLVQKEIAEKITAKEGDLSLLSLTTQALSKPEIIEIVSADKFYPRPKVDSAILRLRPYDQPIISFELWPKFKRLMSAAFSQKRKMLKTSLRAANLTAEEVQKLLDKSDISNDRRPQTLSLEEWKKLVSFLN